MQAETEQRNIVISIARKSSTRGQANVKKTRGQLSCLQQLALNK